MVIFVARLLAMSVLLLQGFCSSSQSLFRLYIKQAYDSNSDQKFAAALNLLYKAQALKGQDTTYNESLNIYLGNTYEKIKKIDSSLFYYGEALKYFEKKKDYNSLIFIYNHLGSIENSFTKRFGKAVEYYKKERVCLLLLPDSANLFDCLNNIGLAYKGLKLYDSALIYFGIVRNNHSGWNTAGNRALQFIADTYSLRRQYPAALRYYDEAIESLLKLADSTDISIAFLNKGDCLMQQERYKESLECFTKAQHYWNTSVTDDNKKELYHNLSFAYYNTGNLKKAYYYKNQEGMVKDSLNTQSIVEAATEMEAKYEVRKNQDSLKISRQNLILSDNTSSQRQRNFFIAFATTIAVGLLAFLGFRNARIKNAANVKLAAEKAKVESLAGELSVSNQTKARLFSVISHDLRSPISSLFALLKMKELKAGSSASSSQVSGQILQLLDTLEDLLMWSKSQMDKFILQPVKVNVHELYAELLLIYNDMAQAKSIYLNNIAAPHIFVFADENLLKTVLRNTVANAIGAAPINSTVTLNAVVHETHTLCTISNYASYADFQSFKNKLDTATVESSVHGLGTVLMKEFAQKLNIELTASYDHAALHLHLYFRR